MVIWERLYTILLKRQSGGMPEWDLASNSHLIVVLEIPYGIKPPITSPPDQHRSQVQPFFSVYPYILVIKEKENGT